MMNLRLIMDAELFRGVVPFVLVVEERSMKRAARRLGVSPAAISKAIRALEERLAVRLLARSARGVALTREGAAYAERCKAAVAALSGAEEALSPSAREPAGDLSVSTPFVAAPMTAGALALLKRRYPRLVFRLSVSDRLSKLEEEGVDIAVRIGALAHKSLVARRLARTRLVTVASPAYLAARGTPKEPADLERHDCLTLTAPDGRPHAFVFASGRKPVPATLVTDHGPTLVAAAVAGLGVTQLFDGMAEELVRDGKLAPILAHEVARGPDVFAVCTEGRKASAKVRAAFDAFAETFGRA
jgi:DNA-binding transcriptional LysR family regulator